MFEVYTILFVFMNVTLITNTNILKSLLFL